MATSLVNKFALPSGHIRTGKGVKATVGKTTIILARTMCGDAAPRLRAYTTGSKPRALKSFSGEQAQAFALAIAFAQPEPTPEPEPTPTRKRKASKRKSGGVSKKAQPSLGRGVAAAEASLKSASAAPKRPKAPALEDGEHHFAYYRRCAALGVSPESAKRAYRKQAKARK